MKKCTYCGLENPDEATVCSTCQTEFVTASPSVRLPSSREYVISPAEQRFWRQITFRQVVIIILRMVALWLLFTAVVEATSLPSLMITLFRIDSYSPVSSRYGFELALALLRIAIHVAAGLGLILYTEQVLGWLVKDLVSKPPQPAAVPSDSTDA